MVAPSEAQGSKRAAHARERSGGLVKTLHLEVVLSKQNSDGEGIERPEMRSLAIIKPMNPTNSNKTRTTAIKQAASLIAMALAPLAVVIGIAVMNVPSADAGVGFIHCVRKSGSVQSKACQSSLRLLVTSVRV